MSAKQPDPSRVNRSEPCEIKDNGYATGREGQTQKPTSKSSPNIWWKTGNPAKPCILVINDDDAISKELEVILLHAGLASERVKSMKAGCEYARSGRFQVVVTKPAFADGSWERLADIDRHYSPGFVVILITSTFDLNEWGQALEDRAFEVFDALRELPQVAEAARRALWAAYLKGAGPRPEVWNPQGVA
jgi:DNA-binding NtrC family response regulator